VLSRRGVLKLAGAGAVAAALAACGAESGPGVAPRRNAGAAKTDGRILFAKANTIENGGKDDGIWVLDNGKARKLVGKQNDDYALQYPRWSPDGSQIAYARYQDRGIYANLWIMNADGTNNRRITDFQSKIPHQNNVDAEGKYVTYSGIVAGISWSKGGNFITFISDFANDTGAMRPWTYESPDQPPTLQNLHVLGATANFNPPGTFPILHIDDTELAPDGNAMAFVGRWIQPDDWTNRQTQLYLLDIGTKKHTQLTDMPQFKWGAYDPAFSPDGQTIVFTGRPDYRVNDLFVMTRDGKNATQITQTGAARSPVWSPDGKRLAFVNGTQGGQFAISIMDVTPPPPGTPYGAANFGRPDTVSDESGIDARSGLSWAQ
jgi:Tol biopolymer transport system component